MSSPVARPAPRSKAGIRYQDAQRAALELFAERGFSRVGMRDLAAHMGIAAGSLYNHIESKEALLFEFIEEFYSALTLGAEQLLRSQPDARSRLHALLERHLQLHQSMPLHFRLAEYELCCLPPEPLEQILELRERYEQHWLQAVAPLCGQTPDAVRRGAVRAIVSLLNQLPAWTQAACDEPASRLRLQQEMVLGALAGALGMAVHAF
ncbi:TetR/AcrR family transcriptional regulator [Pseudomonas aeruginosa]|uniref:TetR/AcrR family transcriptional regulator n=1 Tax=Pseudomonas aeruginosa TaxID=287 RepID=UPI0010FC1AB2|nr:TetR/AcrR family transcriptional regulator [Pseudomonas aeruginosa]ARS49232.1 hypothetical protein PSMEN_12850 [Pseudomonas mendocina]MCS7968445.1 TetR/AcrR family transcriptional regulator [Pseudomonas aeruginosa]MCS8136869.1 TetR/AcrR family transcriptional regulator [Pseudomonas aeruginosa]MCS8179126.1 TetR/AcrR family transcriptional regulator [Pseudomonas aeruginosa]MCS8191361.1 TetR/AcrR family transcriptional regulator [Pseudomonas aeruginosa]